MDKQDNIRKPSFYEVKSRIAEDGSLQMEESGKEIGDVRDIARRSVEYLSRQTGKSYRLKISSW